jgi:hypothetical protein
MALAFVDDARMVRAWLLRVYYGCLSLLLLEHQGHWKQATTFAACPQPAKSHDGHASPAVNPKFWLISEWPGISRS